jgi:membrane-associated PAP2 superfamily phosphatase
MKIALALFALALAGATLFPTLDLHTSALFHTPDGSGFRLRDHGLSLALHEAVQGLPRLLAAAFLISALLWPTRRKAAIFLLIAGIAGPILIANTLLKDHWGRARPRDVTEFGGQARFTRAWLPAAECHRNCSFVSGDGALGFYLHSFFYVAAPRWRRTVFAAGFFGTGLLFGGIRIAMGAHFLSDVLWAGALMLLSSALVHTLMYGGKATRAAWVDVLEGRRGELGG